MITERTYNRFHLMISEKMMHNGCTTVTAFEYYAQTGIPFEQQPKQFQLAKRKMVTYENNAGKTRSEITQTEFDCYGNPTMQITPDGTKIEWTYYAENGSAAGCPKEMDLCGL